MRRERLIWLLAVVLLGVAGPILGLTWRREVPLGPPVIRAFVPAPDKTAFRSSGWQAGPVAVAPDGSRLVFSAGKIDADMLWLRPIDSMVATPLAGTEGASYPFWSPDGRSIGFFAAGKLKRIDPAGGPALTLCDASDGRGGTWSSEGVILFAPNVLSGLFRVAAEGGTPLEVTRLDESRRDETHRWPQFLPGGRKFIFFSRIGARDEGNAVMVGSLDGGGTKLILRTDSNALYASGHLLFLRQSTLMAQPFNEKSLILDGEAVPIAEQALFDAPFSHGAFSASENGLLVYQTGTAAPGTQLTWFDRGGKKTGVLGDRAPHGHFSISPDLKRVAVDVLDLNVGPPDVWIYEVARGLRTRFTFERAPDNRPIWSPDGSQVVFSSARRGHMDLYMKSYTGSADEQPLLEADGFQAPESWSPDGRHLAYSSRGVLGGFDVWVLPLFGDRKPFPFLQTEFREEAPQFSPDGRWIAYSSDESGRAAVYVAPFPGPGRKWQISSNEGRLPRWRNDGREIYYLRQDNTITAVEVSLEGSTVDIGTPTPLFVAAPVYPSGTIYQVTPDGQRFLVNIAVEEQHSSPLTLVMNWTADLKRR